jgi:hypothetical protein
MKNKKKGLRGDQLEAYYFQAIAAGKQPEVWVGNIRFDIHRDVCEYGVFYWLHGCGGLVVDYNQGPDYSRGFEYYSIRTGRTLRPVPLTRLRGQLHPNEKIAAKKPIYRKETK